MISLCSGQNLKTSENDAEVLLSNAVICVMSMLTYTSRNNMA